LCAMCGCIWRRRCGKWGERDPLSLEEEGWDERAA